MKRQLIILNGLGCAISMPLLALGLLRDGIDARLTSFAAISIHGGISAVLMAGKLAASDGQLPELTGYSVAGMALSLPPAQTEPQTVDTTAKQPEQPQIPAVETSWRLPHTQAAPAPQPQPQPQPARAEVVEPEQSPVQFTGFNW